MSNGGVQDPEVSSHRQSEDDPENWGLPGIRNDTGIITIKDTGKQYTISCFTKGAPDVYSAEEAIAKTSKAAYDYFTNKN